MHPCIKFTRTSPNQNHFGVTAHGGLPLSNFIHEDRVSPKAEGMSDMCSATACIIDEFVELTLEKLRALTPLAGSIALRNEERSLAVGRGMARVFWVPREMSWTGDFARGMKSRIDSNT